MATTSTPTKVETIKVKKAPIPMGERLDSQITKAVLANKMSVQELTKLSNRLARLLAFVSAEA